MFSCLGATVVYANLLLRRRLRYLPPGLAKAKFIRLGYLKAMLTRGERICRCQDLPDEAFGDVSLAAYLIIVSHRWLHPYMCDICTDGYPCGVKLDRLVCRLEAHFSKSDFCGGTGFSRWLNRLHRRYCIGGWDVVIFFDFTSIPQRRVQEDGSILQRAPEEQAVFEECLPNMGTLYALFPVLVLNEVPPGDNAHNYIDSGWCTCELAVAMLGQTLDQFSKEQLGLLMRRSHIELSMSNMSEDAAAEFEERARAEIGAKHFLHDSDRNVAMGIVQGFMSKRVLVDAILRNEQDTIRIQLVRLRDKGLLSTLDEPVDENLNTLLHLAVRVRSTSAVQELLHHGAKAGLRNLRGDTPTQWFLLPRCSKAAALCRSSGHERLADVADAEILGRAGGSAAEGAAPAESVEVDPQGMVAKKTSSESAASPSAAIDDTNHPLGVVCVAA